MIGGGGHGLATAYYLASRHGIKNVGVFERSYIGVRGDRPQHDCPASQLQDARVGRLLQAELRPVQGAVGQELDYNLLFSRRGLFWLAHSENALRLQRERALLNQAFDVDTVFITPAEVKKLCPQIDLTAGGKGHPIVGASFHPPGAIAGTTPSSGDTRRPRSVLASMYTRATR